MGTVDIKQQELDFVEQQILTDIFGGYTPDKFVYRFGFMKIDLEPKVQKLITDFETFIKPYMEEDGSVDVSKIKKYVNEQYISLPDGKYRLIEIYRKGQPFLTSIIKYLKG
jgi:hypothetical protein